MIDPAVKIALACCVFLAGVCAALLFRCNPPKPVISQSSTPPATAAAPVATTTQVVPPAETLRIRHAGATATSPANAAPKKQGAASNAAPWIYDESRTAIVVTPSDRRESPPHLADAYPEPVPVRSSSWGIGMHMLLPLSDHDETHRTHKVVDGDKLNTLAKDFLGSADRASEIFEANRDVLSDPELLPIGVELKLPPRGNPPESEEASTSLEASPQGIEVRNP
jgi:nucleoid-associated protein YgaU